MDSWVDGHVLPLSTESWTVVESNWSTVENVVLLYCAILGQFCIGSSKCTNVLWSDFRGCLATLIIFCHWVCHALYLLSHSISALFCWDWKKKKTCTQTCNQWSQEFGYFRTAFYKQMPCNHVYLIISNHTTFCLLCLYTRHILEIWHKLAWNSKTRLDVATSCSRRFSIFQTSLILSQPTEKKQKTKTECTCSCSTLDISVQNKHIERPRMLGRKEGGSRHTVHILVYTCTLDKTIMLFDTDKTCIAIVCQAAYLELLQDVWSGLDLVSGAVLLVGYHYLCQGKTAVSYNRRIQSCNALMSWHPSEPPATIQKRLGGPEMPYGKLCSAQSVRLCVLRGRWQSRSEKDISAWQSINLPIRHLHLSTTALWDEKFQMWETTEGFLELKHVDVFIFVCPSKTTLSLINCYFNIFYGQ